MNPHLSTVLVQANELEIYLNRSGGTQEFATGMQQELVAMPPEQQASLQ
jgi:hypothetical protein